MKVVHNVPALTPQNVQVKGDDSQQGRRFQRWLKRQSDNKIPESDANQEMASNMVGETGLEPATTRPPAADSTN